MNLHRAALKIVSPEGSRARLLIFSFHRVLEQSDALLDGEPDRREFREMLRWISDLCDVLPLSTAISSLRAGRLPACAAAITFDDGYRNNLTVAKPELVAAGLPATVFIAVEGVRSGWMWNDLVIEAVRRSEKTLDLTDLGLGVTNAEPQNHVSTIDSILSNLKYRPFEERRDVALEVHRRGVGERPKREMLTENEIEALRGDGIDLGAHTLNHPILTKVPDDVAWREIHESKMWLQEITGKTPELFAYPNGRPSVDYDSRHVEMVRQAGFSAAVSTRWGATRRDSSVFELPRFVPWERERASFASRLIKICAASYFE